MNYTQNILECYENAQVDTVIKGLEWYAKLNKWCYDIAHDYDIAQEKVVGVFSAISPMMPFERNIDMTIVLLDGFVNGIERDNLHLLKVGLLTSVNKAFDIMVNDNDPSDFLGKQKTFRFYHNIMYPLNREHVTIDTWAWRIALGQMNVVGGTLTAKKYREIEDAYKLVADIVGLIPHQLQAITWEHVRKPMPFTTTRFT